MFPSKLKTCTASTVTCWLLWGNQMFLRKWLRSVSHLCTGDHALWPSLRLQPWIKWITLRLLIPPPVSGVKQWLVYKTQWVYSNQYVPLMHDQFYYWWLLMIRYQYNFFSLLGQIYYGRIKIQYWCHTNIYPGCAILANQSHVSACITLFSFSCITSPCLYGKPM